jgi:hypothetical protein
MQGVLEDHQVLAVQVEVEVELGLLVKILMYQHLYLQDIQDEEVLDHLLLLFLEVLLNLFMELILQVMTMGKCQQVFLGGSGGSGIVIIRYKFQ